MDSRCVSSDDCAKFIQKYGGDCQRLLVFGYGSLVWKVDFEYNSYMIGYVKNYERRFNQGNENVRGTKEKRARVANLEDKPGGKVWGVAYEICGKDKITEVLRKLYIREISNGGYKVTMAKFHPRKCKSTGNVSRCCSETHHNIPLPPLPCGLSKSHQSQNTNPFSSNSAEKPVPSMQEKSPLSLPWCISDSPSRQVRLEPDVNCPCLSRPTELEYSPENRKDNNSLQNTGSQCHSHAISDNDVLLESAEDRLSMRKASFDLVNHSKLNQSNTRQTSLNHISNDNQTMSLESRTSNFDQSATSRSEATVQRSLEDLDIQSRSADSTQESPMVLLFTVTPENSMYIRDDGNVDEMATQIVEAKGEAGSNVEYVLRISDFIKKYIPEDDDTHLFDLDDRIRAKLSLRVTEEEESEKTGMNTDTEGEEENATMRVIS